MGDNGTNNYQNISETGGISKLSLTVSNLKSHNHIVLSKGTITNTFEGISSSTSSNGDHGHSLSIQTSGAEAPGYSLGITNTGFGGRTYIYGGGYTNFANAGSHTHTIIPQGTVTSTFVGTSINTSSNGAHSHNVSLGVSANEAKGYGLKVAIYQHDVNSPFYDRAIVTGGYTGSSIQGSHSHTVTPQGTVESKFTGTETTTSSVGNGEKFSIQNPYITVYMWKRTA